MPDVATWPAPTASGPVRAVVPVPGSKSLTNRWLVLAALADGPSRVRRPLRSRDTTSMVQALRSLGVAVQTGDDQEWVLTPPAGGLVAGPSVDCGQAGTVMRFVPPVAALATGAVRFDGHPTARTRPVGPVLTALAGLGVEVTGGTGGTLPYTVHGQGRVRGGTVGIDASASSQFVSALLLAGARFEQGVRVEHRGAPLPSRTHVEMTLQVLAEVGVPVRTEGPDTWVVPPGPVHAFSVDVEPDLSSAAPFLALAAATGGSVTIPGWPRRTTQPGARMLDILARMGASSEQHEGHGLRLTGPTDRRLGAVDLDLSEVGELTPVVAALATLAEGTSRLRGIAHLRGHETDRLHALATEIRRLGAGVHELDDGLDVVGGGSLRPARLATYHDHRMAMFAAVVGAVQPGVLVEDVATADKTFPGFDRAWSRAVRTAAGAG